MSYDLMLFHAPEKVDLLGSARRIFSAEYPGEAISEEFEDEEYERQRRLVLEMLLQSSLGLRTIDQMGVRDIAAFVGEPEATVEHAIGSAGDSLAAMGVQTFLGSWSVIISLPYWYQGQEADDVLSAVIEYSRWFQLVGGYAAYDPQQDKILDLKADFRNIASKYSALENRGLKK